MLNAPADPSGSFVSASDLAVGATIATAPPPPRPRRAAGKSVFRFFQALPAQFFRPSNSVLPAASSPLRLAPLQACQEIYIAWKDHDFELAKQKQQRIVAANKRIVGDLGIPGVKYGCDFNGYYGGRPRSPLLPLTAEEKSEVETLLTEIRN